MTIFVDKEMQVCCVSMPAWPMIKFATDWYNNFGAVSVGRWVGWSEEW